MNKMFNVYYAIKGIEEELTEYRYSVYTTNKINAKRKFNHEFNYDNDYYITWIIEIAYQDEYDY